MLNGLRNQADMMKIENPKEREKESLKEMNVSKKRRRKRKRKKGYRKQYLSRSRSRSRPRNRSSPLYKVSRSVSVDSENEPPRDKMYILLIILSIDYVRN